MKTADRKSTKPKVEPKAKTEVVEPENTWLIFVVAVANMSWQLAIVVVLPIVAGFKLDQTTGLAPIFAITGIILALIMAVLVVKRNMHLLGYKLTGEKEVK